MARNAQFIFCPNCKKMHTNTLLEIKCSCGHVIKIAALYCRDR